MTPLARNRPVQTGHKDLSGLFNGIMGAIGASGADSGDPTDVGNASQNPTFINPVTGEYNDPTNDQYGDPAFSNANTTSPFIDNRNWWQKLTQKPNNAAALNQGYASGQLGNINAISLAQQQIPVNVAQQGATFNETQREQDQEGAKAGGYINQLADSGNLPYLQPGVTDPNDPLGTYKRAQLLGGSSPSGLSGMIANIRANQNQAGRDAGAAPFQPTLGSQGAYNQLKGGVNLGLANDLTNIDLTAKMPFAQRAALNNAETGAIGSDTNLATAKATAPYIPSAAVRAIQSQMARDNPDTIANNQTGISLQNMAAGKNAIADMGADQKRASAMANIADNEAFWGRDKEFGTDVYTRPGDMPLAGMPSTTTGSRFATMQPMYMPGTKDHPEPTFIGNKQIQQEHPAHFNTTPSYEESRHLGNQLTPAVTAPPGSAGSEISDRDSKAGAILNLQPKSIMPSPVTQVAPLNVDAVKQNQRGAIRTSPTMMDQVPAFDQSNQVSTPWGPAVQTEPQPWTGRNNQTNFSPDLLTSDEEKKANEAKKNKKNKK